MFTHNHQPRVHRGFTLIELASGIAVLGLLMALGVVSFLGHREAAWDADAQSSIHNVALGARALAADDSMKYPPVDEVQAAEPSITVTAGPSTHAHEVSTAIDSERVATFAALSKSGTCWVRSYPLDGGASEFEGHEVAEGADCLPSGPADLGPVVSLAIDGYVRCNPQGVRFNCFWPLLLTVSNPSPHPQVITIRRTHDRLGQSLHVFEATFEAPAFARGRWEVINSASLFSESGDLVQGSRSLKVEVLSVSTVDGDGEPFTFTPDISVTVEAPSLDELLNWGS